MQRFRALAPHIEAHQTYKGYTPVTLLSLGLFSHINYWAVIVAGLLTFFIGGLWYSPALFEAAWMTANGYNEEQARHIQSSLGTVGFASAFLCYLAMAMVFALLITMLDIDSVWGGLLLGFLIWLGFVATSGLTVNLFSVRSLAAWGIDAGYQFVFLLMTGAILAAWR